MKECLPRPAKRLKRGGNRFYWSPGPPPSTPRGGRRMQARDDDSKSAAYLHALNVHHGKVYPK